MSAGRRNKKVVIQKKETTLNEIGEQVITWVDLLSTFAAIETEGGREYIRASEIHADLSLILTVRFNDAITTENRVLCDDSVYEIVAAFSPDSRHRESKIYCYERL